MTNALQVLDQLYAALGPGSGAVPRLSPRLPDRLHLQPTDKSCASRISRISRGAESPDDSSRNPTAEEAASAGIGPRVSDGSQKASGNPGNTGNAGKSTALSGLFDFPPSSFKTEMPGNEGEAPSVAIPTGVGAGESQGSGGPRLPVTPEDVRAGVSREMQALAPLGRTGRVASRDAVEIVRAKLRNAVVLVERQARSYRCHVCDEPLDDAKPVVSVLQMKPGHALHMHAGECHDAHRVRKSTIADGIMAAAGYGSRSEIDAAVTRCDGAEPEADARPPRADAPLDRSRSPDIQDT